MKYFFLITSCLVFFAVFAHAQVGYENNNIPHVPDPERAAPFSNGSSNVSSVVSGDSCVFVNPTTGNVIITFNTSCAGAGNATFTQNLTDGLYIHRDGDTTQGVQLWQGDQNYSAEQWVDETFSTNYLIHEPGDPNNFGVKFWDHEGGTVLSYLTHNNNGANWVSQIGDFGITGNSTDVQGSFIGNTNRVNLSFFWYPDTPNIPLISLLARTNQVLFGTNTGTRFFTVGGDAEFTGNVTAPNLCYSDGTNCTASGGGTVTGINGTSNQINVQNFSGNYIIGTPQDINRTSKVAFAEMNVSGLVQSDQYFLKGSSGSSFQAIYANYENPTGVLQAVAVTVANNGTGGSTTTTGGAFTAVESAPKAFGTDIGFQGIAGFNQSTSLATGAYLFRGVQAGIQPSTRNYADTFTFTSSLYAEPPFLYPNATEFLSLSIMSGGDVQTNGGAYIYEGTTTSRGDSYSKYNATYGGVDFYVDSQRSISLDQSQIITPPTAAALGCSSTNEGAIYYNLTSKKHFGCNSTTWNALY